MTLQEDILKLARFISEANQILVFTGSGISTESGISDYRSKGGLWNRFQPVTIQEFLSNEEKRKQYWQIKYGLMKSMKTAKPNAGHKAILELEKLGKLKGIITQNIDGLHHMAGSAPERILELHGTNRQTVCLSCGDLRPWNHVYERLNKGEEIPLCDLCQGLLKPNTISFGQNLNADVLNRSMNWACDCDLLLALGSTLIVEPAASIPRLAKQNGATLVIITLSETPLDNFADLKLEAPVGETMNSAVNACRRIKSN